MPKGKPFKEASLEETESHIGAPPSLEPGKFDRTELTGSLMDQVHYLLHSDDFTLTEISRFLDENGHELPMTELRQFRKLMKTLSATDID